MAVSRKPDEQVPADAAVEDQAPAEAPAEEKLDLFAEAQKAAPNITREFVKKHKLDDDWLAKIARGELSPPPMVGPERSVDQHYINGGWQSTPVGVKPEDVDNDRTFR